MSICRPLERRTAGSRTQLLGSCPHGRAAPHLLAEVCGGPALEGAHILVEINQVQPAKALRSSRQQVGCSHWVGKPAVSLSSAQAQAAAAATGSASTALLHADEPVPGKWRTCGKKRCVMPSWWTMAACTGRRGEPGCQLRHRLLANRRPAPALPRHAVQPQQEPTSLLPCPALLPRPSRRPGPRCARPW